MLRGATILFLALTASAALAQDLSAARHHKLSAQRDQLFSDLTTALDQEHAALTACRGGEEGAYAGALIGDPLFANHYVATDNVLALLAVVIFLHVVTYNALRGPRGLFPLAPGFPVAVQELDFANERVVIANSSGCDMDLTGARLVALDEDGDSREEFHFEDGYTLVDGDAITVVSGCDEDVCESEDAEARPLDSRFNNMLFWTSDSVFGNDGGEVAILDADDNVVHRVKATAAVYM